LGRYCRGPCLGVYRDSEAPNAAEIATKAQKKLRLKKVAKKNNNLFETVFANACSFWGRAFVF
jgi:hypothetical protein